MVGALLLFVAVMAGKVAYRFGAPALLLFLGVGMLFGLNFISFRSVEMTQFVGMIALCIILFTGGMDTSFQEIKPYIIDTLNHDSSISDLLNPNERIQNIVAKYKTGEL